MTPRPIARRAGAAIALAAVGAVVLTGCGGSDTTEGTASMETALTAQQKAAFARLEKAYDQSDVNFLDVFEVREAVPRLERWDATEKAHQADLVALAAAVPAGECRSAVESLISHEKTLNGMRTTAIGHYRDEDLPAVLSVSTEYADLAGSEGTAAEKAIVAKCGLSAIDPADTGSAAKALTAAQRAAFAKAQKSYALTVSAYDEALAPREFDERLTKANAADKKVTAEMAAIDAVLEPGACRDALGELADQEAQQEALRDEAATAGAAAKGDPVAIARAILTVLSRYVPIDTASQAFQDAQSKAEDACKVDIG